MRTFSFPIERYGIGELNSRSSVFHKNHKNHFLAMAYFRPNSQKTQFSLLSFFYLFIINSCILDREYFLLIYLNKSHIISEGLLGRLQANFLLV